MLSFDVEVFSLHSLLMSLMSTLLLRLVTHVLILVVGILFFFLSGVVVLLAFAVSSAVTFLVAAVVDVFVPDEALIDDVLCSIRNVKSNSFILDVILDANLEEDD